MVAWLFPGQGTQHRGMGGDLFDRFPDLVAEADAELGYSIAELCRTDPGGRLTDTRYAQPALFVVQALAELARVADGQAAPRFLAGHSVGEYAALFAAGAFDFGTGVRLVRRRGELMSAAGGGGMLAVVGPAGRRIEELLATSGRSDVDIANHNAEEQVVLAGPVESLQVVADVVGGCPGSRGIPLRVSAAFHSRYMVPAAEAFADSLAAAVITDPGLPVIANVTAEPYPPGAVRQLLAAQIRSPVRWADSMRYLIDQGVREVAELGPGLVLTRLWQQEVRRAGPRRAPDLPGPRLDPAALGSAEFRRDYDLRLAYLAGAMYRGIASTDLVIRMARAGLMGFFGAGGLTLRQLEEALATLRGALGADGRFGMNLLCTLDNPDHEAAVVDLYLRQGVRFVEAAAYPQVTAPLVRFRASGAHRDGQGRPTPANRVVAKVSRPEVATAFLRPPASRLLEQLVATGQLGRTEAEVAARLPVSDDICVESDSGGHTDGGIALTLLPSMVRLRDQVHAEQRYPRRPRVGASGGLGTPEAVAAVFLLGAEFAVTGSINQCTPQAGTSVVVKDLLARLDISDTAYAPAGDTFELGGQVQAVRRGTLFAARATRLLQLYRQHRAIAEVDEATVRSLERDYFGRSLSEVWAETREYLAAHHPDELARTERDPRRHMAHVFKWYFRYTTEAALRGDPDEQVNYQIHCGPAMGAFNRWVKGTDLEDWRHRHVDVVAERLMCGAAELLGDRLQSLASGRPAGGTGIR